MSQAYAADPVVLTFSTAGDSREDPTTVGKTAQDAIWLQNSKAWSRIMRTIQTQKPSMLFFNGDIIMGYGTRSLNNLTPIKNVWQRELPQQHDYGQSA
jgi:hypothetical protein